MSDKLQKAIQATRSGDTKNAQFLLTQAIQEDPNNPQSWYLLSLIVEDKDKKKAYLTKVIELDPDHAKAHEQLIVISEAVDFSPEVIEEESVTEVMPVSFSSDSSDLEVQDEGETLSDWTADDLLSTEDTVEDFVVETEVVPEEEPVSDWLDGTLDEAAASETNLEESEDKEDTQPAEKAEKEKKEVATKEKKTAKEKDGLSEKQLNYLLIGLVIIAILIFMIMAYMVFTMM